MCEIEKGPELREETWCTSGPLRQPDRAGDPLSQPVRLGTVVRRLVESLETRVNRNAITKP